MSVRQANIDRFLEADFVNKRQFGNGNSNVSLTQRLMGKLDNTKALTVKGRLLDSMKIQCKSFYTDCPAVNNILGIFVQTSGNRTSHCFVAPLYWESKKRWLHWLQGTVREQSTSSSLTEILNLANWRILLRLNVTDGLLYCKEKLTSISRVKLECLPKKVSKQELETSSETSGKIFSRSLGKGGEGSSKTYEVCHEKMSVLDPHLDLFGMTFRAAFDEQGDMRWQGHWCLRFLAD